MIAQYYSINFDEIEEVKLGHFVFKEDSDELAGFIYAVNKEDGFCEVVLFEPAEIPENATVLEMTENMTDMLKKTLLKADDQIKNMWKELVKS